MVNDRMSPERKTKAELVGELGMAIRRDQNASQAFDELAAQLLGINLTDLRCIDIVEQRGRLTAGELAEAAHLTTGAVTAVLDRLERAGYARRVRDTADRRRVLVELTGKIEAATGEIWGPAGAAFNRLLDRYTAAELQLVIDLLQRGAAVQAEQIERLKRELRKRGCER